MGDAAPTYQAHQGSTGPRFSFKTDSLPKLSARGDNFVSWKNAWNIAFNCLQLQPVIKATTYNDDSPKRWEAHAFLISSVEPDLIEFVTSYDHPAKAWKALCERYDRDTGLSSVHLLRSITEIRMAPETSLRDHLDAFHRAWMKMEQRCNSSTKPVAGFPIVPIVGLELK